MKKLGKEAKGSCPTSPTALLSLSLFVAYIALGSSHQAPNTFPPFPNRVPTRYSTDIHVSCAVTSMPAQSQNLRSVPKDQAPSHTIALAHLLPKTALARAVTTRTTAWPFETIHGQTETPRLLQYRKQ